MLVGFNTLIQEWQDSDSLTATEVLSALNVIKDGGFDQNLLGFLVLSLESLYKAYYNFRCDNTRYDYHSPNSLFAIDIKYKKSINFILNDFNAKQLELTDVNIVENLETFKLENLENLYSFLSLGFDQTANRYTHNILLTDYQSIKHLRVLLVKAYGESVCFNESCSIGGRSGGWLFLESFTNDFDRYLYELHSQIYLIKHKGLEISLDALVSAIESLNDCIDAYKWLSSYLREHIDSLSFADYLQENFK